MPSLQVVFRALGLLLAAALAFRPVVSGSNEQCSNPLPAAQALLYGLDFSKFERAQCRPSPSRASRT
jgi:hypothetical protein